jgi:hypothetical protein
MVKKERKKERKIEGKVYLLRALEKVIGFLIWLYFKVCNCPSKK